MFREPTQRQIQIGLMILRVVVGAIFLAHGAQKLFVFGFAGVGGAFGQMGVPLAGVLGPFVALVEFLGGLGLIAGLLTRLAALGLWSTMAVAILLVHWKAGFFLPNGYEYALSLLGANTLLALTGAGAYSADALIARPRTRGAGAIRSTSTRRAA